MFIVPNPGDFVRQVLAGKKVSNLCDTKCNKLSDHYPISLLTTSYLWLETVYNDLSGYIHLSSYHLLDSKALIDDISKRVYWDIIDRDIKYREDQWIEVFGCLNESINMFFH